MSANTAPPDLVADLLLRFYREPVRYREQMRQVENITGDLGLVLRLAAGRRVELTDPVLKAENPTQLAHDLRAAAAFHIQQVFFRPDATHYQVLGLRRDADLGTVREHFRLLMQLIHPDRQDAESEWPTSFATRANVAYTVLKNASTRSAYDQQLPEGIPPGEARRATRMVVRPTAAPVRRPAQPLMPDWMTDGVRAFVLQHPSLSAFGGLMVLAALMLFAIAVADGDAPLTRDGIGFDAPSTGLVARSADVPAASSPLSGAASARAAVVRSASGPAASIPTLEVQSTTVPLANNAPLANEALASGRGTHATPAGDGVAGRGAAQVPAAVDSVAATRSSARASPQVATSTELVPLPPVITGRATAQIAAPAVSAPLAQGAVGRPPAIASTSVESAPIVAAGSGRPSTQTAEASDELISVAVVPARPSVADRSVPLARATPISADAVPVSAPESAQPVLAASRPASREPHVERLPARAEAVRTPAASPAVVTATVPATVAIALPSIGAAQIDALFAALISAYETGRIDALASVFDEGAVTNVRRGRAAIRKEYDELFRLSTWRQMRINDMQWVVTGEGAKARGDLTVTIGWRDGREAEQRVAFDMDIVSREGQTMIGKLTHVARY